MTPNNISQIPERFLTDIRSIIEHGRQTAYAAVGQAATMTYPQKEILHDFVQNLTWAHIRRILSVSNLTTPAKKTKIYGYLEALLGESKSQKELIKEANRNYENPQHWNLDSNYLLLLKDFFSKFTNVNNSSDN